MSLAARIHPPCTRLQAGIFHRAATDLHEAIVISGTDVSNPGAASDRQMIASDLQLVQERQEAVGALLKQADELLAAQQPRGATGDSEAVDLEELQRVRSMYDEALELQPLEVAALANRAACLVWMREPYACATDCEKALTELDREGERRKGDADLLKGMFAPKVGGSHVLASPDPCPPPP